MPGEETQVRQWKWAEKGGNGQMGWHTSAPYDIIIAKQLLYFILATFLPPIGETEKYGI
jgi:hypothetical protein